MSIYLQKTEDKGVKNEKDAMFSDPEYSKENML